MPEDRISWKRGMLAILPFMARAERIVRTARWARDILSVLCPILSERESLYQHVQDSIGKDSPLIYLEFGVAQGTSLKWWCSNSPDREARFWGFDTFTGLPERWNDKPIGTFTNHGIPPSIDDPRVGFCLGLFQDTLPGWLPNHDLKGRAVVHIDCDLYSSTLYVLAQLDRYLLPGSVIIFDEFWDANHEYRALHDWSSAFMREYTIIGATRRFAQVAIQIVDSDDRPVRDGRLPPYRRACRD